MSLSGEGYRSCQGQTIDECEKRLLDEKEKSSIPEQTWLKGLYVMPKTTSRLRSHPLPEHSHASFPMASVSMKEKKRRESSHSHRT